MIAIRKKISTFLRRTGLSQRLTIIVAAKNLFINSPLKTNGIQTKSKH